MSVQKWEEGQSTEEIGWGIQENWLKIMDFKSLRSMHEAQHPSPNSHLRAPRTHERRTPAPKDTHEDDTMGQTMCPLVWEWII